MKDNKHFLALSGLSVAALSPVPVALCNAGLSMSYGYAAAVAVPALIAVPYLAMLNRKRQAQRGGDTAQALPA